MLHGFLEELGSILYIILHWESWENMIKEDGCLQLPKYGAVKETPKADSSKKQGQ